MNPEPGHKAVQQRSDLRPWLRRHHRLLGLGGAAVAAGMTALWMTVVPEKVDTTSGIQALAIRWGHPLCWAFLTTVGLLVAADAPKRLRDGLAISAGVCYAGFVLAMLA